MHDKLTPYIELLGKKPDYRIAVAAGVSPMTVRRLRVKLGIPPYSRTPERIKEAVAKYEEGVPVLHIASEYQISLSALYNALRRQGVPLRKPKCKEE